MKSLILYGSRKKLTNAHKPVTVTREGQEIGRQPEYYVRADLFNGDIDEALDKAKPMEGELVLNTCPATDADAAEWDAICEARDKERREQAEKEAQAEEDAAPRPEA